MSEKKGFYELSDDELENVFGGLEIYELKGKNYDNDLKQTRETKAGDFVPDAYRRDMNNN